MTTKKIRTVERKKKETNLPVVALRLAAALAGEAAEGNDLLLVENVVEVLLRADERHALDRRAHLAHVLEARAHIHRARLHRGVDVLRVVRVVVCHLSATNKKHTQNTQKQQKKGQKEEKKKNTKGKEKKNQFGFQCFSIVVLLNKREMRKLV